MKRVLLICLSLVLALSGLSVVCAEDGFYVIPSMKVVPKTGQTTSYGTRDDGALQKGVASPTPRFTDNGNGTVTDNLTRLIWMKNANAFGQQTWDNALSTANNLKSGDAGLTDGSKVGDWRLPNLRELQSLVDYGKYSPPLPDDHPFTDVVTGGRDCYYWSSTTNASITNYNYVWNVDLFDGDVVNVVKSSGYCVVCARRSLRLAAGIIGMIG
jgi:hypothetical protein